MNTEPEFDAHAEDYDRDLAKGIAVSGESREYFACERVRALQRSLATRNISPRAVLDFGCGTGGSIPFLLELSDVQSITGIEVSAKSLAVARKRFPDPRVSFELCSEYRASSAIDLAFCNGVFHHIRANERAAWASYVFDALKPGGHFSFWENNPWNPGTRWVMSRIPFDRDADPMSVRQGRRLLEHSGFVQVEVSFHFFFPRMLRAFRVFDGVLRNVPFGAQYHILAQKPRTASHAVLF